ncbi:250_t:CDS:2, partial [Rhizophagus irregularis]
WRDISSEDVLPGFELDMSLIDRIIDPLPPVPQIALQINCPTSWGSAWISRKRYQLSSRCPRICFKAPLLLDVLFIRRQSASNAEAFRDFKVRCDKSLSIDGTIDDQLQDINENVDYDENEDDIIPLPPSANRES